MKLVKLTITVLSVAFFFTWAALPAQADSIQADCVMVKKGEKAKQGTGPCKTATRAGLIDIELKKGRTFNLKPT